jgi:UDP-N-acetylglucosamine--N-acetylmuramyl-(pentapeptide) pyrophosphoryl-undecaprenol N-acetylglucosamine transferase
MNENMAGVFALEQRDGFPFHHIHATGSFGWEWMPGFVKEKGVDLENATSIDMREYIFNMPTVMAAADVIISRAGAATCNEIGASATPSILIPSPNVTANHQEKNARVLYDHGVTVLVLEKDCTPEVIYREIRGLLSDEVRREAISAKLRKLVRLDSTERICDIVEEITKA